MATEKLLAKISRKVFHIILSSDVLKQSRRIPRYMMSSATSLDMPVTVEGVATKETCEVVPETGQKRKLEDDQDTTEAKKEQKTDDKEHQLMEKAPLKKKKKVALLLSYIGKGFYGLQIQRGFPTIEGTLINALLKVGVISQGDADSPQKMSFQRAARTDKGVSAAGNLISLKMSVDQDDFLEKINKELPGQIRVQACIRTTRGFNSKNYCDARTYTYLAPTFAFAPCEMAVTTKYRMTDDILERIQGLLKKFEGTHNFHNYTSGLKPTDPSAKRYIIKFQCSKPFLRDDMEFVQLTVHGQSFVLHHIRKMTGLTMAIVRGHCLEDVIEKTWSLTKMDIPKAPGNGLLLDELHYTGYNKRYGGDGIHQSLDWADYREKLDQFKEEFIFKEMIRAEKEESVMMSWMNTLVKHDFDEIPEEKLVNWKFKNFKDEKKVKSPAATAAVNTSKTEASPGDTGGDNSQEEKDKQSSASRGNGIESTDDQTTAPVDQGQTLSEDRKGQTTSGEGQGQRTSEECRGQTTCLVDEGQTMSGEGQGQTTLGEGQGQMSGECPGQTSLVDKVQKVSADDQDPPSLMSREGECQTKCPVDNNTDIVKSSDRSQTDKEEQMECS